VDGSLVARVHEADRQLVDQAAAARRALEGPWGQTTVPKRVDLLRRVADRIEERFDDLMAAEIADTGKPVPLAREGGEYSLHFYAEPTNICVQL
jgi:aminomuconate-semialdehyde/2-hydroxymuconate-6-semialdehyde dehydrogenase